MVKRTATIKDVALLAGVSTATVSHVINGTRQVGSILSDRVNQAIYELGYRPNLIARSLRKKGSGSIGVILVDDTHPFFCESTRGVRDAALEAGYNILVCNSCGEPERENGFLEMLAEKRVEGIILFNVRSSRLREMARLRVSVPVVLVDREGGRRRMDSVVVDHYTGALEAMDHLLSLGHGRIAVITGPTNSPPSLLRLKAYSHSLERADISCDKSLIRRGDFSSESGYNAVFPLIASGEPPTAIFAFNDLMAYGAITALADKGLRVPEDVSVVGYDDIQLSSFFNPPLTTVSQPKRAVGRAAFALLRERIANESHPARCIRMSARLVVRRSTSRPGHTVVTDSNRLETSR